MDPGRVQVNIRDLQELSTQSTYILASSHKETEKSPQERLFSSIRSDFEHRGSQSLRSTSTPATMALTFPKQPGQLTIVIKLGNSYFIPRHCTPHVEEELH
jgi:hypothetical protein